MPSSRAPRPTGGGGVAASGELSATYDLPEELTLGGTVDGGPTVRPRDTASFQRGMQLGRYVVLSQVGAGGMGVVYAAYDPELDRKLAIKVLRARRSRKDGPARLLREAQALARLDHPNVVAIHDVGTHEGRVFVAMDFLEGPTLSEWAQAPERSWREILDMYIAAGEGLAAAHDAGIVHRDFKPDNVIVADGRPRVLDFGLARASGVQTDGYPTTRDEPLGEDSEPDAERMPPLATDSHSLGEAITRAGAVLGTPAFMSPEQHLGHHTGPATDQFSFAVSLHEALWGEGPFGGETVAARAFAVTQGQLRPAPKSGRAPTWIRKRLVRALAVDPDERWPDMRALLSALQDDPMVKVRRWGFAGASIIAAAALVFTAHRASQSGPVCADPEVALGAAWSQTRSSTLSQVFERSPLPFAAATQKVTVSALDDYATRWRVSHAEACAATRIRHEQSPDLMDRRMSCLDSARRRLRATVDRLEEGDEAALERAPELVGQLPSLERCDDAESLLAAYPPPTGAAAKRLGALDERLAAALAQRAAGEFTKANAVVEALLEETQDLDYPPFRAELTLAHAELLEALGRPREAETALHAAMRNAEIAHEDRRVAEARILAILIVGDRLTRTDEGYMWVELSDASLQRIGGDPALEARRLNNLALVHSAAGRYREELEAKRASLATLEALPDADPVQIAAVHNNLAASLAQQAQYDDAIEHARKALDMWTELLGPDHPKAAIGWGTLGLTYDYAGRYTEAKEMHERSVALLERSLGKDSPRVAEVLNNLAISHINLGDVNEGVKTFRRVVDVKSAALGAEHLEVAYALGNLGSALRMAEDIEGALEVQERARAILEAGLDPMHPRLAGALSGLANTYEDLGRIEESLALRERVLAIEEKAYGKLSPEVAIDLGNLSWALLDAGDDGRARELAQRGLQIVDAHPLKPDVAGFLRLVAARAALTRPGGRREARALVEAALEVLGDLPAPAERKMVATIDGIAGWSYAKTAPSASSPAP